MHLTKLEGISFFLNHDIERLGEVVARIFVLHELVISDASVEESKVADCVLLVQVCVC